MDKTYKDTSIPVTMSEEVDKYSYTPTVDEMPENREIFEEYASDEPLEEVESYTGPDDIEIEGAPYERNNPYLSSEKPTKDAIYGTKQVANTLGITPQTVRNYLENFNDFLNVSIVKAASTSRAQFTKEDIENLRTLIKVKDENHFTVEQMREYMANPNNIGYMPESRQSDHAFQLMLEAMRAVLDESVVKYQNLIGQQDTAHSESINKLNDQIKAQNDEISSMKEILEKQSKTIEDLTQKTSEAQEREIQLIKLRNEDQVDGLKQNISSLNEDIEQKILKISQLESENSDLSKDITGLNEEKTRAEAEKATLQEENKLLQEKIEELQSQMVKKKKFLGIF